MRAGPGLQLLALNAVAYALWHGLFSPVTCAEDVVVLPRELYNDLLQTAARAVDGGLGCSPEGMCDGYAAPIDDDIPGLGDLDNTQVPDLQACADACSTRTECKAFEFSQTVFAVAAVAKNCQLVSHSAPLAGAPYGDFKVYIKDGSARPASGAAAAAPAAVAAAVAAGEDCDVSFTSDPRFTPQINAIKATFSSVQPTFEELYRALINRPYTEADSIWRTLRNPYELQPSLKFPFSNLRAADFEVVLAALGRPPKFMVEAGSFHGNSALTQLQVLQQKGYDPPLLCIDPWTGDLGMLLFRDDWEFKLTPGELNDGRSTSYWQFMVNVRDAIEKRTVGAKQVVPLVGTAVVGARYLLALGIQVDTVYLDSAHERDETYFEMKLFYETLTPGGVLFGDDYGWEQVRHDVDRFVRVYGVELRHSGATWFIQKK